MKKSSIITAVLCVVGIMSCTTEDIGNPDNNKGGTTPEEPSEPGNIELSVTAIPISGADGTLPISWNSGDKLSIWTDNGDENSVFSLKSSSQESGIFTGNIEGGQEKLSLFAAYPYSETYTDYHSISLELPTEVNQESSFENILKNSAEMFGKTEIGCSDTEYNLKMQSPYAFVNIIIDGSNSYFSDGNIERLTMTTSSGLAGKLIFNIEDMSLETASGNPNSPITINYPQAPSFGNPNSTWIAIKPSDLTSSGCVFEISLTNGQKIKITMSPETIFNASEKYTITIDDIDGLIAKGSAEVDGIDLVAKNGGERANCYIISHGGRFRFAADFVNPAKDVAFDKSQIVAADWLWSTGNESLLSDVIYAKSGNIYFYVRPGSRGNAVIAAKDNNGEIVWSWHIWMCDTENPLEPLHYTRNEAWKMSDRNLGAISNQEGKADSYGLYYQWGRKDPFIGVNQTGSATAGKENEAFGNQTAIYVVNTENFNTDGFKSVRNTSLGNDDIAYITRNPMYNIHFNSEKSGNNAGTNTWAYNLTLEQFKTLWNSSTSRNEKTIYDPCPAGYCVPVSNDYAWKSHTGFKKDNTGLAGYIFDGTGLDGQSGRSYYPPTGYRNAGQMTNLGFTGIYWSATFKADTNTPYALVLENDSQKNTTVQAQRAHTVRCMKIE